MTTSETTIPPSETVPRLRVSLIAAVARNGVIGRDGGLPWRLKSDMAHFKAATIGKPCVMGRKTFQSLKKPLPDRMNVVITRDLHFFAAGAWAFATLESGLKAAAAMAIKADQSEVCVIGGGEIYAAAMAYADALILTEVQADAAGDIFFPQIPANSFIETSRRDVPAGPQDDHACIIRVLERRDAR
jgi:dihydrofolate reductase